MNAFEFMTRSPILSFLIVLMVLLVVESIAKLLFRCWAFLLRHLSIRKAGWPPAHLDADGDFKTEPKPKAES